MTPYPPQGGQVFKAIRFHSPKSHILLDDAQVQQFVAAWLNQGWELVNVHPEPTQEQGETLYYLWFFFRRAETSR